MHGRAGHDDVVAEEDSERLVAHQGARAEDGVPEPEGLLLADVGDGGQLRDGLDLGELLGLAAVLQVVLELEGGVEVVLDGALVAAGDEHDLVEPRRHRLLHHVLDGGLVDQGQHLLRLRLGGGEEPGAEPGGGKDGFADGHGGTWANGSAYSDGVRTWMPSFFTRYQRLRSEMPSSLAARACTPLACRSASRIICRSQFSSASSSGPASTGAASAAGLGGGALDMRAAGARAG